MRCFFFIPFLGLALTQTVHGIGLCLMRDPNLLGRMTFSAVDQAVLATNIVSGLNRQLLIREDLVFPNICIGHKHSSVS